MTKLKIAAAAVLAAVGLASAGVARRSDRGGPIRPGPR